MLTANVDRAQISEINARLIQGQRTEMEYALEARLKSPMGADGRLSFEVAA